MKLYCKMARPCSIMIVEDDQEITRIYSLYFARLGIDTIVFTNPRIALDHFHQYHGRYTMILLDWTLPGMNGLELAKSVRKCDSKVKILLHTGYYVEDLLKNENFRGVKVSGILSRQKCIEDLGSRIIKLCSESYLK